MIHSLIHSFIFLATYPVKLNECVQRPCKDTTELMKTVKVNYFPTAPVTQRGLNLVGKRGRCSRALGSPWLREIKSETHTDNNLKVRNFWILCINGADKKQNGTVVSTAHSLLEKPKGSSMVLCLTEKKKKSKKAWWSHALAGIP